MPIATGPTLTCPVGKSVVAVIAKKGISPVAYANVKLVLGALFPWQMKPEISLMTNAVGLAQSCITNYQYTEAHIQKSGEDFGSGEGAWHKIGSVAGTTRGSKSWIFTVESITVPPPPEVPAPPPPLEVPAPPPPLEVPPPPPKEIICTIWDTMASPYVPSKLMRPFSVSVSGAKWACREDPSQYELVNGIGKIIIGQHTFDFPIANGYGLVDLSNFINIDTLIAELAGVAGIVAVPTPAPTIPLPTIPTPTPTLPTDTVTIRFTDYLYYKRFTPLAGKYWAVASYNADGDKVNFFDMYMADSITGANKKFFTLVPDKLKYINDFRIRVLNWDRLGTEDADITIRVRKD